MNQALIERVPRVPHWRWVMHCGKSHDDYNEPFAQLQRYVDEEETDLSLSALVEPTPDVKRAISIYLTEPPIRETIESMLYERCSKKLISDALFHKYKEAISENVVRQYSKYFYDTEIMNNYEMAKYFERSGQKIPKAPPVPGHMKEGYIAFKNGVETKLDPQQAMMHMFQTSFFRAQELSEYGWVADDKIIKFQKSAMDILKTMREGEMDQPIPEEFIYEVEYPSETSIDVSELDDYDPEDDPNEEDLEDV